MAHFNESRIDMFVVGTNGLSTAGPRISIHFHDLIDLLKRHEERAVVKYIKKRKEDKGKQQRLVVDTRATLDTLLEQVEQNIIAENIAIQYDTQCVLEKIILEIEDLETMNQFSLKISDILNGNQVLIQLLLPKLLSSLPVGSTPDQMIERLYRNMIKEVKETIVMYKEWKRSSTNTKEKKTNEQQQRLDD